MLHFLVLKDECNTITCNCELGKYKYVSCIGCTVDRGHPQNLYFANNVKKTTGRMTKANRSIQVAWNWEGEDVMCRLPLTGVAAVSLFFLT
jgi:hypothetical protein